MKKQYGEFSLEWSKVLGSIQVDYEEYDAGTGDNVKVSEIMPLFDFLSSLGITMNQCVRAFMDEDAHLK